MKLYLKQVSEIGNTQLNVSVNMGFARNIEFTSKNTKCLLILLKLEALFANSDADNAQSIANRNNLIKLLDLIKYISTQGLAFRGHNEQEDSNNQKNFLELCKLFGKYDSQFKQKFEGTFNYTSATIQQESLHCLSTSVLKQITKEVMASGFFSLMADEATTH